MFSDYNVMKLKINNNKILNNPIIWRQVAGLGCNSLRRGDDSGPGRRGSMNGDESAWVLVHSLLQKLPWELTRFSLLTPSQNSQSSLFSLFSK